MTSHHTISSITKCTRYHKAYILSLKQQNLKKIDWRCKIQDPYWTKLLVHHHIFSLQSQEILNRPVFVLEILKSVWKFWKLLKILNRFWKFWKLLKILNRFWKLLKILNRFWTLLKILNRFWKFWTLLKILNRFWTLLKILNRFWTISFFLNQYILLHFH